MARALSIYALPTFDGSQANSLDASAGIWYVIGHLSHQNASTITVKKVDGIRRVAYASYEVKLLAAQKNSIFSSFLYPAPLSQ